MGWVIDSCDSPMTKKSYYNNFEEIQLTNHLPRQFKNKTISDNDNGGTINNIRKTVHILPALSEVVSRAAADIHGI